MLAKAFNSSVFEDDATSDDFPSSYEQNFSSQSDINESTVMGNYGYGCFNLTCALKEPEFAVILNVFLNYYTTLPTACIGIVINTGGMYFLLHGKGRKQMFNLLLALNLMFDTMYLLFCIHLILRVRVKALITQESARATYYILAKSGFLMSFILSVWI